MIYTTIIHRGDNHQDSYHNETLEDVKGIFEDYCIPFKPVKKLLKKPGVYSFTETDAKPKSTAMSLDYVINVFVYNE